MEQDAVPREQLASEYEIPRTSVKQIQAKREAMRLRLGEGHALSAEDAERVILEVCAIVRTHQVTGFKASGMRSHDG